jgi:hypothetical protein
VLRRPKRPAHEPGDLPANGIVQSPPANGHVVDSGASVESAADQAAPHASEMTTALEPFDAELAIAPAEDSRLALAVQPGPQLLPDPGLYAVLGLDPSVSDEEIQTTYRRRAARVHAGGANAIAQLRQLNVAYEVLGNHVRRVEYDRMRLSQVSAPSDASTAVRPGMKTATPFTRRRRPRAVVQPRYAGLPDVLVVLMVVGLAVLAGALVIPRLSINLSVLNVLQNVLPLASTQRRAAEPNGTPAQATRVPTPTVAPGVAARFAGSSVAVSDPNPPQSSAETITLELRRDGKPASDADAWAIVHYSTTDERWPASGSVKTDANGRASITANIGRAIPDRPVVVDVFAQADNQQLSWSTSFTPR